MSTDLLTALRRCPVDREFGLCWNILKAGVNNHSFVEALVLMRKWPECVKPNAFHPRHVVPGYGFEHKQEEASNKFPHYNDRLALAAYAYLRTEPGKMWNYDHPYGAARWRLRDWLITQLENH